METRFLSPSVADEGRTMCGVADNLEKTIVYNCGLIFLN